VHVVSLSLDKNRLDSDMFKRGAEIRVGKEGRREAVRLSGTTTGNNPERSSKREIQATHRLQGEGEVPREVQVTH